MNRERSAEARFNVLLALLVFLFAFQPFLPRQDLLAGVIRVAIELTLVAAIFSLRATHPVPTSIRALVVVFLATNEALHWLVRREPVHELAVAQNVSMLLFLTLTVALLSWIFWRSDRVGPGFVAGAVSIYLMLGFLWGSAFGLLELVSPGSFQDACAPRPDGLVDCRPALASFPRLVYFGFVSLTTLGYGDVLPLTVRAERLATLAAVSGQLFLALLIGRLVAMVRR